MQSRPYFDMEVVGKNLRRLRKEKNLKVSEVREYLGFESDQAVYKYETGRGDPQVDTMFALMQLYDADINDLIIRHDVEGEGLKPSPFGIIGFKYKIELSVQ